MKHNLYQKSIYALCNGMSEHKNEVAGRIRFLAAFQKPRNVVFAIGIVGALCVAGFCLGNRDGSGVNVPVASSVGQTSASSSASGNSESVGASSSAAQDGTAQKGQPNYIMLVNPMTGDTIACTYQDNGDGTATIESEEGDNIYWTIETVDAFAELEVRINGESYRYIEDGREKITLSDLQQTGEVNTWQADLTHDGVMETIAMPIEAYRNGEEASVYIFNAQGEELDRFSGIDNRAYSIYHTQDGDYLLETWVVTGSVERQTGKLVIADSDLLSWDGENRIYDCGTSIYGLDENQKVELKDRRFAMAVAEMPASGGRNDIDALMGYMEQVNLWYVDSTLLFSALHRPARTEQTLAQSVYMQQFSADTTLLLDANGAILQADEMGLYVAKEGEAVHLYENMNIVEQWLDDADLGNLLPEEKRANGMASLETVRAQWMLLDDEWTRAYAQGRTELAALPSDGLRNYPFYTQLLANQTETAPQIAVAFSQGAWEGEETTGGWTVNLPEGNRAFSVRLQSGPSAQATAGTIDETANAYWYYAQWQGNYSGYDAAPEDVQKFWYDAFSTKDIAQLVVQAKPFAQGHAFWVACFGLDESESDCKAVVSKIAVQAYTPDGKFLGSEGAELYPEEIEQELQGLVEHELSGYTYTLDYKGEETVLLHFEIELVNEKGEQGKLSFTVPCTQEGV